MFTIYSKTKASYYAALIKAFFKYRKIGNDTFFTVQGVSGKGDGLFTTKERRAGELVFIATGPTVIAHFTGDDCYKYPDWYAVDKDTWIDIQYPFIKINHSCDPNTGIDGHRLFVALRDIKAGDELTFDYSISDDEEEWIMTGNCACGAENCSGSIGPVQSMSEERYKKSYPYIPKYFQKLYASKKLK
jgi:uncharacterized protein